MAFWAGVPGGYAAAMAAAFCGACWAAADDPLTQWVYHWNTQLSGLPSLVACIFFTAFAYVLSMATPWVLRALWRTRACASAWRSNQTTKGMVDAVVRNVRRVSPPMDGLRSSIA